MSLHFRAAIGREEARRQLRMSIVVVVSMAVVALLVGFVLPTADIQASTTVGDTGVFSARLIGVVE